MQRANIAAKSPERLRIAGTLLALALSAGVKNRCRAAPLYPLAVTASATADEVENKDSSVRDNNELNRLIVPLHPSARQSTPRAANPKLMFLTSSNTIAVNRNDNNRVKTISSTGALNTASGRRYQRIPDAMASGVVVHRVRCADCRTVKVRQEELTARLTPLRVT